MLRKKIRRLLENQPPRIKELIEHTLDYEQRYISFGLNTNSSKLREIKKEIRKKVDKLLKDEV